MGQRWEVGEHGFTLLELVVTLMVLAFALAVVGPAVGPIAETIRARTEVVRLAALLRHTREQAIATGRSRALVVDPPAHRVSILIGEEVREASKIAPALRKAREMVAKNGKSAVINIWVDPNEYAPGTKNQTMYK